MVRPRDVPHLQFLKAEPPKLADAVAQSEKVWDASDAQVLWGRNICFVYDGNYDPHLGILLERALDISGVRKPRMFGKKAGQPRDLVLEFFQLGFGILSSMDPP